MSFAESCGRECESPSAHYSFGTPIYTMGTSFTAQDDILTFMEPYLASYIPSFCYRQNSPYQCSLPTALKSPCLPRHPNGIPRRQCQRKLAAFQNATLRKGIQQPQRIMRSTKVRKTGGRRKRRIMLLDGMDQMIHRTLRTGAGRRSSLRPSSMLP